MCQICFVVKALKSNSFHLNNSQSDLNFFSFSPLPPSLPRSNVSNSSFHLLILDLEGVNETQRWRGAAGHWWAGRCTQDSPEQDGSEPGALLGLRMGSLVASFLWKPNPEPQPFVKSEILRVRQVWYVWEQHFGVCSLNKRERGLSSWRFVLQINSSWVTEALKPITVPFWQPDLLNSEVI